VSYECRRVVVGSLAHLKNVLGFLFVERELLIEDGTTTNIVKGLGPKRLIAQRDPSTHGTTHRKKKNVRLLAAKTMHAVTGVQQHN